jgi:hypothetical protein
MKDFMSEYTPEEVKSARRFLETCEDGEGYDIPKTMMRQLALKGLVKHVGFGIYEATDKMQEDITP